MAVVCATLLAAGILATGAVSGASARVAASPKDTRIMLVGGSVAETLGWGLSVEAPRWHVEFEDYALIGCGVTRATPMDYGGVPFPTEPYCQTWPQIYAHDVAKFHPQVAVLLAGRWEVADAYWRGHWTDIYNSGYAAYIASQLALAIHVLSAGGAKVALLTAPYYAAKTEPFEPIGVKSCSPGCNRHFSEDDPGRVVRFNQILAKVAASFPGVATVVPFGAHADPGGHFAARIGSVQVRNPDGVHFTVPAGGEWAAPWLYPRLLALAPNGARR
ncbi:MAG: hypothetical protein M0035_12910 [Actinomycetota bacterium]|nr:hypothetical protein [Actinomycetota bacterium]